MTDSAREKLIESVLVHLEMFEYGFNQTYNPRLEEMGVLSRIPQLYNLFAGLHLISTLFLVDKQDNPMGGFIYLALKDIGLEQHLEPIKRVLETKTGKTTFGDFIRLSRNKLATHGLLELDSIPETARSLPEKKEWVREWQNALENLVQEVTNVKQKLEQLIDMK